METVVPAIGIQYTHTCDKCVFLEHFQGKDWYCCRRTTRGRGGVAKISLLARHSSSLWDYTEFRMSVVLLDSGFISRKGDGFYGLKEILARHAGVLCLPARKRKR